MKTVRYLLLLQLILPLGLLAADPARVAILSDPENAALADQVTAELSSKKEVELVERSEIEKVLREQKLSIKGPQDNYGASFCLVSFLQTPTGIGSTAAFILIVPQTNLNGACRSSGGGQRSAVASWYPATAERCPPGAHSDENRSKSGLLPSASPRLRVRRAKTRCESGLGLNAELPKGVRGLKVRDD